MASSAPLSATSSKTMKNLTEAEGRTSSLVDFLFLGGFTTDTPRQDRAVTAIIAAAVPSQAARRSLRRMYRGFEETLVKELGIACQEADPNDIRAVAYGLMCMAEHHSTMLDLGVSSKREHVARDAARMLIESLSV